MFKHLGNRLSDITIVDPFLVPVAYTDLETATRGHSSLEGLAGKTENIELNSSSTSASTPLI